MHKFFAKTSFLGKNIIYLPDCHSTNSLLAEYAKNRQVKEGTIIVTDYQSAGRGQRGNQWHSVAGENLLFSFYIRPSGLEAQNQYLVNLASALSMVEAIEMYHPDPPQLEIKWPNDIYLHDKKLAGILIETQLSGKRLEHVVVGMGLNVHQRVFDHANATSLDMEGCSIDRWDLLETFAESFEQHLKMIQDPYRQALRELYLKRLRWLNEPHQYQLTETGKLFTGQITGIDDFGRLTVIREGEKHAFDIQQIKFIV